MDYLKELQSISDTLEAYNDKEPRAIAEYLVILSTLSARINGIIPHVKMEYDNKLAEVTQELLEKHGDNMKGNTVFFKNYTQGKMKDYQKLVNFCERINSTINTQSRNLVTVLSYEKTLNNY